MITFKLRHTLVFLLLSLLLGLAACLPAPELPTSQASPTPSATSASSTTTPVPSDEAVPAEESGTREQSEEILVNPTLAPTATPGAIYDVVNQVAEATNLYETRLLGLLVADWINLVISLVMVFLALTLIARLIFVALMKIAKRTVTPYDEIYLQTIRPFLRWLFGLITLYIATARLQFLSPAFKQWLGQIYYALVVMLVVIGLWKLVDVFNLWYQDKVQDQNERGGREAALLLGERAVRALIALVGLIIILDHFGFNISALLTAIGIGGLALSLAAQDTIANMISGVIILIDQPFRAGDRIEIQELNTWGDVISIGLRSTRIRTLDNRLVIVPNSGISNNQVVNYTFPDPRYRIQTEIGVAYGTDLRFAREVITKSLKGVEGVIPNMPVDVLFLEWGDSEMVLRVRWWIESYVDARRSTDRVNEHIYQALEEVGIEMPWPTMTVELKNRHPEDTATTSGRRREDE
jgi:small-conductance mechanosensitive channel